MTDAQYAELMPILRSLADSMQRIAHVAEQGERRRGAMVPAVSDEVRETMAGMIPVHPMRQDHTERSLAKAMHYLQRDGE
jgi:hypothetical protein